MTEPLKIGIGVHGRFHAFGLAAGLLKLGHDVSVFTNYPASIATRFGLPTQRIRGFPLNGVAVRLIHKIPALSRIPGLDGRLHAWFGAWLAKQLIIEKWDATYTWSSISKEYLNCERVAKVRMLARGSTHIRKQWQLLQEEEVRTGCPIEKPTEAIMLREEAEYALADAVVVLSRFCQQTFLDAGFSRERVRLMVSAVDVDRFTASPESLLARKQRMQSNEPLRILSVGTFSYRKGAQDLVALAKALPNEKFHFRFVGTIAPEAAALAQQFNTKIEFIPRVAEPELREHYAWADVFVLPSIEEGLAAVLPQAAAAGLLILATPNSGAEDVIQPGQTGWVLPARDPDAFANRLKAIANERQLPNPVSASAHLKNQRDWSNAAADWVEHFQALTSITHPL